MMYTSWLSQKAEQEKRFVVPNTSRGRPGSWGLSAFFAHLPDLAQVLDFMSSGPYCSRTPWRIFAAQTTVVQCVGVTD